MNIRGARERLISHTISLWGSRLGHLYSFGRFRLSFYRLRFPADCLKMQESTLHCIYLQSWSTLEYEWADPIRCLLALRSRSTTYFSSLLVSYCSHIDADDVRSVITTMPYIRSRFATLMNFYRESPTTRNSKGIGTEESIKPTKLIIFAISFMASSSTANFTARAGDTVAKIASDVSSCLISHSNCMTNYFLPQFGMKPEDLVALNPGLQLDSVMVAGQNYKIPAAVISSSATASSDLQKEYQARRLEAEKSKSKAKNGHPWHLDLVMKVDYITSFGRDDCYYGSVDGSLSTLE